MSLAAFLLFVVPWMAFAAWMYTLPSAIRLGVPQAPWRPLLIDYSITSNAAFRNTEAAAAPSNAPASNTTSSE